MEVAQQYCLKWNNYQSTLHHVFHKLWVSKMFVDVSLVVEGKRIDCHKVVLSACSTYFEQILSEHSSHPHPIILLHDVPITALEALVTFMYKGEIKVNQDQLAALLKVAKCLKIKGLADSDAISDFNKYHLVSPDITKITCTGPPTPTFQSSLPSFPNTTFFSPSIEPHADPRCLTLPMQKSGSNLNQKRASELSIRSNLPQKKRIRLDDLGENLPPSPPVSLESQNIEIQTAKSSSDSHSDEAKEDSSDIELQIDIDERSSVNSEPRGEVLSNRNTPLSDAESREILEKHETAQSLAALACQGVNVFPHHHLNSPHHHLNSSQHHLNTSIPVQISRPCSRTIPLNDDFNRLPKNSSGKQVERSYTLKDLEDGIQAVLSGRLTPAKAIANYKVPRRTFFRRLSTVRKSRCVPSSKENSLEILNSVPALKNADSVTSTSHLSSVPSLTNAFFQPVTISTKLSPDDLRKDKKSFSLNSGNVFSLLNVAANPRSDYMKCLNLTIPNGAKETSGVPEEKVESTTLDDNKNIDTNEQPISLVMHNVL